MMSNKIQVLDAQLSNMIAAGEVVERPASAVKELVENSVDADATKIEIHLQDSGVRQIKVIDNGLGMSHGDAKLAFLRHATSKVKSQHDIMRISTLGFRGEALPSIAAVSDVHLKTSDGEQEGYHIHIKGGNVVTEEPFAIRKGTEIEVNHLFFNTPARLKHIKSLNTELSHITDYMTKTALAHPNIAITLTNNNREIFKTPGNTDAQTVISRIYGFDIAKKMHQFSGGNDDFKITGLITEPEITRAARHYVTLVVNNRPIKNYELVRTVIEAYHTFLPKDRYPIALINIDLDPLLVDVNVHPAKIEVRFSKENALKSFILTEIQKTLKSITYIPAPTFTKKHDATNKGGNRSSFHPKGTGSTNANELASFAGAEKNFANNHHDGSKSESMAKESSATYSQSSLLTNHDNKQSLGNYQNYQGNTNIPTRTSEIREASGPGYSAHTKMNNATGAGDRSFNYPNPVKNVEQGALVAEEKTPVISEEVAITVPDAHKHSLELYYIGQLHGTYLLAQNEEGLFLIDQHAAMERVEYEKNYPLLGSVGADSMELLVPITLSYPVGDLVRIKDELPRLTEFGFEVEEFGSSDLIVRTTPVWAAQGALPIVETIISTLLSGRDVSIAKLREAVSIMMSCKKSIKANQYINEAEVRGLLADLCKCEQPYTCPHGRPIIIKMTKYEIERLFKRA